MVCVCAGIGNEPKASTVAAARTAVVAHLAWNLIRLGLLTAELGWNIGLRPHRRNGWCDGFRIRVRLECRHPIGNDWTAERLHKARPDKSKKEHFMAKVEAKLAELGVVLPTPAAPVAN